MPTPADLDDLARGSAAGDARAFTRLVEATAAEVQAFVAARAPSLALIDEVVQATYVSAYQAMDSYRPNGALVGWLKGIARNRLHEERRRWLRHDHERLDAVAAVAIAAANDDEVARDARNARLASCLERLPATWRAMVTARYWTDTPVQDIAEHHGTSPGSVSQALYRARQALMQCLDGGAHG